MWDNNKSVSSISHQALFDGNKKRTKNGILLPVIKILLMDISYKRMNNTIFSFYC